MGKKILKNMDWGILVCIVILLAIGLVALFQQRKAQNMKNLRSR